MSDKLKEQYSFDSSNLLLFLLQWRKPIIVVAAISLVASIIFSGPFFITPKYQSTVILYPASTSSISKALLDNSPGNRSDVLAFGEEEQTEQILQILNSNKIRDRIVKKYNLMEHYDIPANSKYRYTELLREYESNVTFRRTEYMAVKISVMDQNPQLAADMANDIARLIDSTKNDMLRERAIKGFDIVKAEYLHRKNDIRIMEDSLTVLRGFGVHDYESQAEMINRQYAIELAKQNHKGIKALEEKLDVLARYGGAYVSLSNSLEYEREQLSLLKAKFEEAKVDASEVLPQTFIVNYAYASEKKAYPVRWIIVLVSLLAATLFTVIVIIIYENLLKLNSKKKNPNMEVLTASHTSINKKSLGQL